MKPIIITNNPKVRQKYSNDYEVVFIDGTYMEVLITIRDFIHKGHELLTHPLSGSIKPNETPYKSALISNIKGKMNMESIMIIEDSIQTAKKFQTMKKTPQWSQAILKDFSEIDYRLLDSGLQSMLY
ncbi:GrdX family protein [Natronincola ferrireducens]|uniref:GrdX protein n=1 Tax=Natronincola ferrireducens TaxID=393762 RepID=A0A1G9E2L8_9FIRM|nr:GrdX family protein [Natronincola ferrireducens]SDK70375.1 hypothetical protein SAMN05660472_01818 [Natronincola ferrireducens]